MERFPSEIVTPRLLIRRWRPDDTPSLSAAIAESLDHLRPLLAWTRFEPLGDHDRRRLIERGVEEWSNGGDANYGVFVGDTIVGACGLHRRQGPGAVDLGYWVHVDHVGQRIAIEVAGALTTAAFGLTDTARVEIHHDLANARSAAVPHALGFERGPDRPDGVDSPGEVGIDCSWSIGRDDWTQATDASV